MVHLYSSIDTTAAWKKMHFISSDRSAFLITVNLSIAVHTFASCPRGVMDKVLDYSLEISEFEL